MCCLIAAGTKILMVLNEAVARSAMCLCADVCHLPCALQGYAYIEFLEMDAVDNACLLDNSELRGRNIKVGGNNCA